ncbi:9379_t:CDS:2 [Entrophospora sp. SA101]|nr:9379_t:CDS:2 [Entrophospora sp. SA101]
MDYQSYDNNDLINGTNNQGPNRVLHSNGETNFTGSAPIQNNQNAEFADFTHGNLAHDNLNQQNTFNSNSVGPNSMVQIGVNNQNFNLVSHPNGQTNFTGSASIQNNQNVEFTDFIHESFVYNNFNQQDTFNNISVGQNSMILTDANNNNYNNVSTAYQGSQITNTYQNDQIVISRQQLLDIVNQLAQLDDDEVHNPPFDSIDITKSQTLFCYNTNLLGVRKEANDVRNNETDEVKKSLWSFSKTSSSKTYENRPKNFSSSHSYDEIEQSLLLFL